MTLHHAQRFIYYKNSPFSFAKRDFKTHPRLISRCTSSSTSADQRSLFVSLLLVRTLRHPIVVQCRNSSRWNKKKKEEELLSDPNSSPPAKSAKSHEAENPEDDQVWQQGAALPVNVPSPVKGYPTSILNQKQINTFVQPLYHRGWSIEYTRRKDGAGNRYPVPSLQLYFKDLSWDAFFALGRMVRQLQESEKHHGEWKFRGRNALDFRSLRALGLKLPNFVAFVICTHCAIFTRHVHIPNWTAEGVIHGLTLRDVRFAALLDDMILKHNAENSDPRLRITKNSRILGARPRNFQSFLTYHDTSTDDKPDSHKRRKRGKRTPRLEDFYIEGLNFEELEKLDRPISIPTSS